MRRPETTTLNGGAGNDPPYRRVDGAWTDSHGVTGWIDRLFLAGALATTALNGGAGVLIASMAELVTGHSEPGGRVDDRMIGGPAMSGGS